MQFFSFCFSFPFLVVLQIIMLPMLFSIVVISSPSLFFIYCSCRRIEAYTLSSIQASPLLSYFLHSYNQSISSLGYNVLCIVISFLIVWCICWSSSNVHFKNDIEYLSSGVAEVFIPLMIFIICFFFGGGVSRSFLVRPRSSFPIFVHLCYEILIILLNITHPFVHT